MSDSGRLRLNNTEFSRLVGEMSRDPVSGAKPEAGPGASHHQAGQSDQRGAVSGESGEDQAQAAPREEKGGDKVSQRTQKYF